VSSSGVLGRLKGDLDFLLSYLGVPVSKGDGDASPDSPTILQAERGLERFLLRRFKDYKEAVLGPLVDFFSGLPEDELDAPSQATIERAIALAGENAPEWTEADWDKVESYIVTAYNLGRSLVAAKAGLGAPVWNLTDDLARGWLKGDARYWIGQAYGPGIGDVIARTAQNLGIEHGLGRAAVGRALRDAFGDAFNRHDTYWRGLAANCINRARNFGGVESMVQAGVETFEIIAVMDQRTSPICRLMNGKIFRLEHAVTQRDRLIASNDPEAVKVIAPWRSPDEVRSALGLPKGYLPPLPGEGQGTVAEVSKAGESDGDRLARIGMTLPPYHYHCRTTYVVDFTSAKGKPTTPPVQPVSQPPKEPKQETGIGASKDPKSVLERLRGVVADKVELPGATIETAETIEKGMKAVLGPYGVKLGALRWTRSQGANGKYTYLAGGPKKQPGGDTLWINRQTRQDLDIEEHKKLFAEWQKRHKNEIKSLRKVVADATDPDRKAALIETLRRKGNVTRYTVSQWSDDPLLATVIHESGHALYFRSYYGPGRATTLDAEWKRRVLQIDREEWYKISEYAGSSPTELWAETTAAYHLDRGSIPRPILDLYEDMLKNAEVIR